MCKDTPVKRELGLAADITGMSDAEVFLEWFTLYAWLDSQTQDGFLIGYTLERLAASAKVSKGFCFALASDTIRWLLPVHATDSKPRGIRVANWDRHNGQCAKKRALDARRQQLNRAKPLSRSKATKT